MKGGYTLEEDSQKAYDLFISLEGINDDTPIKGIAKIPSVNEILAAARMIEPKPTKKQNEQTGLITLVLEEKDKIKTVGDLKDMKFEKEGMELYKVFENTFFLEPEALDMFLQFGYITLLTIYITSVNKLSAKESNSVVYTLITLDLLQQELNGNKMTAVNLKGKKKPSILSRSRNNVVTPQKLKTKKKSKSTKSTKSTKSNKSNKSTKSTKSNKSRSSNSRKSQLGGVLGNIISWFYPQPSAKKDAKEKANSITSIFKRAFGREEMPDELIYYHGELISVLSDAHKKRFKELLKLYIEQNRPVGKTEFKDTFTGNAISKEILKRVITEIEKKPEDEKSQEDKTVSDKLSEIRDRNKPTETELAKIEQDANEVFERLTKQEVNQLFEKYYVKSNDFIEKEQQLIKEVERKEGKSSIVSAINMNFYKMLIGIFVIMLNNYPDALKTMAGNVEQGIGLQYNPLQDTVVFLEQFRTLLVFIGGFVALSKYIIPSGLGQSGLVVNIANVINSAFWFMAYQSQDTWRQAKEECEGQEECFPNLEYDYKKSEASGWLSMNYGEQISVYGTNMLYGFSNFFLRFVEIILDNIDKYGSVIILMLCMTFITISAVHIKINKGKLANVSESVRNEHKKSVREAAFNITEMNKYVEKTQAGAPGVGGVTQAQMTAVKALSNVQEVMENAAKAARQDLNLEMQAKNLEIQASIADAQKTMASVAARNNVKEVDKLTEEEKKNIGIDTTLLQLDAASVSPELANRLGISDIVARMTEIRKPSTTLSTKQKVPPVKNVKTTKTSMPLLA